MLGSHGPFLHFSLKGLYPLGHHDQHGNTWNTSNNWSQLKNMLVPSTLLFEKLYRKCLSTLRDSIVFNGALTTRGTSRNTTVVDLSNFSSAGFARYTMVQRFFLVNTVLNLPAL